MNKKYNISFAPLLLLLCLNLTISAQIVDTFPYEANFEFPDNQSDWSAQGNTTWEWGNITNSNSVLNYASSGTRCWVTNLGGNYGNNERVSLRSPEFDFSDLVEPRIEFDLWWLCESNDGAVFQSSIDGGITWQTVGQFGDENWFNDNFISNSEFEDDPYQFEGWTTTDDDDDMNGSGWQTMTNSLSNLAGESSVIFRLYFASDDTGNNEGIGFDLVKVYDDAFAYIPDTQFEQYLIDNNIDSDGVINSSVLKTDLLGVTQLATSAYNISDFEGLQYFRDLINFTIINNPTNDVNNLEFHENEFLQVVTIINVPGVDTVSGLNAQSLDSIIIKENGTFLSLELGSFLPNLTTLDLAQSNLNSLLINDFPALTFLNISVNPITEIDLSQCPALLDLRLSNTTIQYLDLQNNTSLTQISAFNGTLLEVNLDNGYNNLLTKIL